jgi:hypothetical protein
VSGPNGLDGQPIFLAQCGPSGPHSASPTSSQARQLPLLRATAPPALLHHRKLKLSHRLLSPPSDMGSHPVDSPSQNCQSFEDPLITDRLLSTCFLPLRPIKGGCSLAILPRISFLSRAPILITPCVSPMSSTYRCHHHPPSPSPLRHPFLLLVRMGKLPSTGMPSRHNSSELAPL